MRATAALLVCLLLAPGVPATERRDEIDLVPEEPANWTPANLLIAFTALLGGWSYWYGERYLTVETVPSGALLRCYYIRANFQKRFETGTAPARLRLPQRAQTTRRDHVTIRVSADGYASKEVTVGARLRDSRLVIRLDPLPNALVSLGHAHIANRSTLTLVTTEEPEIRVSRLRASNGFLLTLTRTASKLETPPAFSGGHVRTVEVSQVGEDLLLRVATSSAGLELRSRQSYDAVRKRHFSVLDLVPEGELAPTPEEIRRRIEVAGARPPDRCSLVFEDSLREKLDAAGTARRYRTAATLATLYRYEAMRQLGHRARGRVEMLDGRSLRTGSPLELELALQRSLEVKGYLALLDAVSRREPEPELVLRSLVAPALSARIFHAAYVAAEAARRACLR